MSAEAGFDVGLSSPALHERNHARSQDNNDDDDGKRFHRGQCLNMVKVPGAQKL
jgi:hypothetical protein